MSIPTFIPLHEAVKRTGADPAKIRQLADAGKINAVSLATGGILVAMEDLHNIVKRADFEHLEGQAVHISEAARRYNLPASSIRGWRKAGHIKTLGKDKNRILINEADIAYIKAIIETVGLRQGQDLTNYL